MRTAFTGQETRGIVGQALGRGRYQISQDVEREIVWLKDWNVSVLPEWRLSITHKHEEVPLPQLASLAARLRANGYEGESLVRSMQEHFELGRLSDRVFNAYDAFLDAVCSTWRRLHRFNREAGLDAHRSVIMTFAISR